MELQKRTYKIRDKITNQIHSIEWDKPEEPTEFDIEQILSVKPKEVESAKEEPVKNSPSTISKLYERAITPLTDVAQRKGKNISDYIQDSPKIRAVAAIHDAIRGYPSGTTMTMPEALGLGADSMTSPLNIATMGSPQAVKLLSTGAMNAARGARTVKEITRANRFSKAAQGAYLANQGLNVGIGAEGAYRAMEADNPKDFISGLAQTAMGTAGTYLGARAARGIPKGIDLPNDIIPENPAINSVNPIGIEPLPPKLPKGLSKTQAKYGGTKVTFEDDIDRALYEIGKPGATNVEDYIKFASQQTGLAPDKLRAIGAEMRKAVRDVRDKSESDNIVIPPLFNAPKSIQPTAPIAQEPASIKPVEENPILKMNEGRKDVTLMNSSPSTMERMGKDGYVLSGINSDGTRNFVLREPKKEPELKELQPDGMITPVQSVVDEPIVNTPGRELPIEDHRATSTDRVFVNKNPSSDRGGFTVIQNRTNIGEVYQDGGKNKFWTHDAGGGEFKTKQQAADDLARARSMGNKYGLGDSEEISQEVIDKVTKPEVLGPEITLEQRIKRGEKIPDYNEIAANGSIWIDNLYGRGQGGYGTQKEIDIIEDTRRMRGELPLNSIITKKAIRSENKQKLDSDIGAVSFGSNVYDTPLTKYDNYEKAIKENFATTDEPNRTKLLTLDGTRVSILGEHADGVNVSLEPKGIPRGHYYTHINNALKQGIVRVIPGKNGGIEIGKPLNRVQAQLLADDWNTNNRGDLNADFFLGMNTNHQSRVFESPIDAQQLRSWSEVVYSNRSQDIHSDKGALGPFDKPNRKENNGWGPTAKGPKQKAYIKTKGTKVGRKITDALTDAWETRTAQTKSDSIERAKRFDKAKRAFDKSGGGAKGYKAELSSLKGKLPIVDSESEFGLSDKDIDLAINTIHNSELLTGQKINATAGLYRLIGEGDGRAPAPNELRLLGKIFGSEFSDKVRELQDDGFLLIPSMSIRGTANEWINFPKGVVASMDFSFPLRQGIGLVHTKEWRATFKPMFKAWANEENFEQIQEDIKNHPKFEIADNAGLKFTELNTGREEAIISSLPERIPIAGKGIIRPSNRAYTTFGNKLRMDTFASIDDAMIDFIGKGLKRDQFEFELDRSREILADYINHVSGRGSLGRFEKYGDDANIVLFSPRLIASRLKMVNPYTYIKPEIKPLADKIRGKEEWDENEVLAEKFIRMQYLKSLGAVLTLASSAIGLAYAMGARSNFDSRSPDFLKVIMGNVRLDVLGGLQQFIVEASQMGHNEKVSSVSGSTTEFGSKYGTDDAMDDLIKFIESKESPTASGFTAWMRGKESSGEEFKFWSAFGRRVSPLLLQDLKELYQENPAYVALIIPAMFGMGVQVQKNNKGIKSKTVKPVSRVH